MIKIRSKNRKWLLWYHHLGTGSENFGCNNSLNGIWPFDPDGASAVQAFAAFESQGVQIPTKCPTTIARLTAGKVVHGITVQAWAQDRARGMLSKLELEVYTNKVPGLFEEVENQKRLMY